MFQERNRTVPRALVKGPLPLLGPAFVTAIAYVDPGNFATNLTAGSTYGYLLVWVVVASNLMAMLIQYLSAKAGIATGKSLPALCREHFPRPVTRGLWGQAEAVAIATDLAEVVGGALALKILFDLPLLVGGTITALVAFSLLILQTKGHRPFEVAITGLLGVILVGFLYDVARSGLEPLAIASGTVPRFDGADSVVLAAGMLGATVMPHAIYLHSALTSGRYQRRTEDAAPGAAAQPAHRRHRRHVDRRRDEPAAPRDRRRRAARRPRAGRDHRGRARRVRRRARRRRRAALRAGAAGLRLRRVLGRHPVGPDRDGGLPASCTSRWCCAG